MGCGVQGTLRVLLVLLHDFPEFLCLYHFPLCDCIPPPCIQMRNLVLSAFSRDMKLPDPFTPNLRVDMLPEIGQAPAFLPPAEALLPAQLKCVVPALPSLPHCQQAAVIVSDGGQLGMWGCTTDLVHIFWTHMQHGHWQT